MLSRGVVLRMEGHAKTDTCRPVATTHDYDGVAVDSPPHCQLRLDAIEVTIDQRQDIPCIEADKTTQQYEKDDQKQEPNGKIKLKFLNGLRGIASLMVVHIHAGYLKESTIAPSGVDTFFVLSAFLLTMLNESKINKLIDHGEGPRQWFIMLLDYFVKRILRVYPLFASVAFVLTVMSEETRTHYYDLAHYNIKHWSIWDILTFKRRYYLFWTMPIEISYYFIIPPFLIGVGLLGRFKWVAIVPLYIWVYHEGGHVSRSKHDLFRPHLSTFVAGSLAAIVYAELSRWMKQHRFKPRVWQLALARAFELIMLSIILSDVTHGLFRRWFHGSLFPSPDSDVPFIALPLSAVIVIETLAPSAFSRGLEWNFLCFTGKISFSMYLLHPFVNFLPWLPELPRIDQFIVRLVLVYALATVSYLLIERNCQRLAVIVGKKLSKFAGSTPAKVESPETTCYSSVTRLLAKLLATKTGRG